MKLGQRIVIVGCGGAGKSTFARELGARLGLDVIHLDRLYWRPGWVPAPAGEWIELQEALTQGDRWIIEGNYSGSLAIRLAAADTAIFLDLPRRVCLWRVLKRRLIYAGRSRPDMGEGCYERLSAEFIRWIWRFGRVNRPRILARLEAAAPDVRLIRLRTRREVAAFLRGGTSPA